jgi:Glyoxalase-like domain
VVVGVERQLPEGDEIFLDHIGWFVPDMNAASRALERLGFLLTPYSLHGDRDPVTGVLRPVGTANRLIMLEQGYLEILTPVDDIDTPVARHMRAMLAERGPGVHLVALAVADATRKAEALVACLSP